MKTEMTLLKLIAIGHIVGGLLLCLLYFIAPLHTPLLQAVYASQPERLSNTPQLIFWLCILGPTIASWGVLFFTLLQQFAQHPSPSSWRGMIVAVLVWAPLDSTLCLLNGIAAGAAGNLAVTVALLLLLWRIRPAKT